MYPFIDTGSGGSADGCIRAINHALEISNDKTVIIPGHGPISNRQELGDYRDMLQTVTGRIKTLLSENTSLAQVQSDRPTANFDETYGGGFITSEKFVEMLYQDLSR
jgi:glyoxylase-like metal-dependent hydrolase (beta-lactamase superfamily II)